METTVRRRQHTAHPITHYWGLVKDMDDSQKLELVTMDDDMLDAALAKFHKDWGGEGTAMEIAEELRSSRENSRTVETW